MNYYISDLHFGCQEIFERTGRSSVFSSLDEMKEEIIRNINQVVSRDDTLYILGDVSCKDYDPTRELQEMKCKKILIKGNHDARWLKHRHFRKQFEDILDIKTVEDAGTRIMLCHYPMVEWEGRYRKRFHFYGHIHGGEGLDSADIMAKLQGAINTCVDVNGFTPKTAAQLIGEHIGVMEWGNAITEDEISEKYRLNLKENPEIWSAFKVSNM